MAAPRAEARSERRTDGKGAMIMKAHDLLLWLMAAILLALGVQALAMTEGSTSAVHSQDDAVSHRYGAAGTMDLVPSHITQDGLVHEYDAVQHPCVDVVEVRAGSGCWEVPRGGGGGVTRVGRWMGRKEFEVMSATEKVVEGAGGRTYVLRPPNPASYAGARPGSVYAEFDVPTNVLHPASKPDWAVIPGPNVTTRIYGPPPAEMPPATCIICVIGE